MYHFTRYMQARSFLLSHSPIKCLNRFPQPNQQQPAAQKTASTFDKEPKFVPASCFCVFFVDAFFPAPSVAKNDCDAFRFKLSPMMILNNDEREGGEQGERRKNVQNFLIKIIDCSGKGMLWEGRRGLYVSDGEIVKQIGFCLSVNLYLFFLKRLTYNIFSNFMFFILQYIF